MRATDERVAAGLAAGGARPVFFGHLQLSSHISWRSKGMAACNASDQESCHQVFGRHAGVPAKSRVGSVELAF